MLLCAHYVFPAHAGMSPINGNGAQFINSFPRPRGDEPAGEGAYDATFVVFPAHAGMSPRSRRSTATNRRFPRPRGDEPEGWKCIPATEMFSPPTRG